MSQAPTVTPEAIEAAPVITALEQAPTSIATSSPILRASMFIDRIQQGLHSAPVKVVEAFAERRGMDPERRAKWVKGAAIVGVAALAFAERKAFATFIDGAHIDLDPFNFVGTAHASTGESHGAIADHASHGTHNTHLNPADLHQQGPSTSGTTSNPDSSVTVTHVSVEEDARSDFLAAARDHDRFGNTFYDPQQHLDAQGEPMSAHEFADNASVSELRAATDLARHMDRATIHQVDVLNDYFDDGAKNHSVPHAQDLPENQGQEPTTYHDDARQDFIDAAGDTKRNGEPYYNPQHHLDENGQPMSVEEYADPDHATNAELRAATEIANYHSTATHDERQTMHHYFTATVEDEHTTGGNGDAANGNSDDFSSTVDTTDTTVDANHNSIPDYLEPDSAQHATEIYGTFADRTYLSISVPQGANFHDTIVDRVNSDMSSLTDQQRSAVAANIQALAIANNPALDPTATVDELTRITVSIPQAAN